MEIAAALYGLGGVATFVQLTFFDGYVYTWWNWLIAIPCNVVIANVWPIYWLILKPLLR